MSCVTAGSITDAPIFWSFVEDDQQLLCSVLYSPLALMEMLRLASKTAEPARYAVSTQAAAQAKSFGQRVLQRPRAFQEKEENSSLREQLKLEDLCDASEVNGYSGWIRLEVGVVFCQDHEEGFWVLISVIFAPASPVKAGRGWHALMSRVATALNTSIDLRLHPNILTFVVSDLPLLDIHKLILTRNLQSEPCYKSVMEAVRGQGRPSQSKKPVNLSPKDVKTIGSLGVTKDGLGRMATTRQWSNHGDN
ncbi:hypothetical protein J6590_017321 [Homalodisca vitripennis]|nr:hypothetical protein J6590_017321 [Homalodisca vitripennis]